MANSLEVCRAYVTIVPSLQGAQKEIATQLDAETEGVGEKSGEKVGSGMSSGMGKALKKGAKVVVGAVTAIATAAFTGIVALTKQAVSSYADFEQLAGGVEKIFGQNMYDQITQDAQDAYKNMNMSANEYLETINDVGAMFKSNMGEEKAYETAKIGMQAIADYASGTGKSVEELNSKFASITRSTSSYQSIADQFAGILPATSADFLKQAQAAGILSTEYEKLTDVPIAEYQEAVSQMLAKGTEELGLAGNTAAEALGTISGSLASTKSAWSNFVTSLASGDVDMLTTSLDSLTESIFGVEGEANGLINNILPAVETTLTTLGTVVSTQLPGIITRLLPVVTGAINSLLMTLGPMLPTLINTLMMSIQMLIPTVINLLVNSADTITALLMGVVQIITTLVTALSSGDNTTRLVNGAVQIITTLVEGIAMNLPILIPAVVKIITQIITTLTSPENIEALLQAALLLLGALVVALAECIPVLIEGVVGLLTNIGDLFVDAVNWVADVLIPTLVNFWNTKVVPWLNSVKEFFAGIWTAIKNKITEIWNSIKSFFVNTFNNIKTNISNTFNSIKTTISNVITNIKNNITTVFNAVKSTVTNTWNGIRNAITTPINAARDAVKKAIDKVKSILSGNLKFPSIKLPHFSITGSFSLSPPKVPKLSIDWYAKGYDQAQILDGAQIFGVQNGQLLGGGERGAEVVVGEQHLMEMIAKAKGGSITINVYASEGMNEETLAQRVAEKLQQITESKEVVYA